MPSLKASDAPYRKYASTTSVLVSLLLASLVAGAILISRLPLTVDEVYHYEQIRLFMSGSWKLQPDVTTLPLLHLVLAYIGIVAGTDSLEFFRILITLISAVSTFLFWKSQDLQGSPTAGARTLQFAFMPIIFPFFFLLYTDGPSLFFLLGSFVALQSRRYTLSAFAALGAALIRQNAIVWTALMFVWFVLDCRDSQATEARESAQQKGLDIVRKHWLPFSIYGAGLCAFVVFVIKNRGVAVGDAVAPPFPTFHVGNVFFALLLFSVLFLPAVFACCLQSVRSWRTALSGTAAVAVAGVLYGRLFSVTQVYNRHDPTHLPWFIRNMVLHWIVESPLHRWIAFIPNGCGTLFTLRRQPPASPISSYLCRHRRILGPLVGYRTALFHRSVFLPVDVACASVSESRVGLSCLRILSDGVGHDGNLVSVLLSLILCEDCSTS
jgi:alpha-1,2-glucosyltransferase